MPLFHSNANGNGNEDIASATTHLTHSIEARLDQIDQRMNQLELRLSTQVAAANYNATARAHSAICTTTGFPPIPLRHAKTNKEIVGFPTTVAAFDTLAEEECDLLLAALDMGREGSLLAKRQCVKIVVGLGLKGQ